MTSDVSSPDHDLKMTTAVVSALDAAAPFFAPLARHWDDESGRRKALRNPENLKKLLEAQRANTASRSVAALARSQRKAARAASHNPLSAARRAAKTADKAASIQAKISRAKLRTARRDYPPTLTTTAVRAHIGHVLPAGIASYALSTPADWAVWPVSTSVALIAANIGALALGRRVPSVQVDDGLSAEETRLMERLDPSYWVQHADDRGLSGTVTTPPVMTPAGIVTQVRMDGRWSVKELRAKSDAVRALVGMRTGTRMEITAGSQGDWAKITVRTRSAADGIDLTGWAPGAPWGVDTITGEPVMVPLGRRMLVAGTSGSGKSWSTRALLAEASETEDHRLVVIDMKRVEALNWEHRARTAVTPDEILAVTDELVEETDERLALVPRGQDVIQISAKRPRITVFVDEGGELLAAAKEKSYARIITNLRTIARMARAAEIILIWATQKPTMSGEGAGIDSQVAGQITYRASLALSGAGESQVVFGSDAHEKGWHAHELPMPGVALLRSSPKAPPHPIRTRAFGPQTVISLPDRPVWQRGATQAATPEPAEESAESAWPALRLIRGEVTPSQAPAPKKESVNSAPAEPATNRDRVLDAVRAGARTNRDVVDRTGINKGTVSKVVKSLVESGELVKDANAGLILGTKEVSA